MLALDCRGCWPLTAGDAGPWLPGMLVLDSRCSPLPQAWCDDFQNDWLSLSVSKFHFQFHPCFWQCNMIVHLQPDVNVSWKLTWCSGWKFTIHHTQLYKLTLHFTMFQTLVRSNPLLSVNGYDGACQKDVTTVVWLLRPCSFTSMASLRMHCSAPPYSAATAAALTKWTSSTTFV